MINNFSAFEGSLSNAILLASMFHSNQTDKGGNPYILHPLKVMHYTRSEDQEIQMIAVMHDLVEDTAITLEDLRVAGFSQRVLDGVDAMTKRDGEPIGRYLTRLMLNNDAVVVKMADLRHNSDISRLKGLSQKDFARMERYQQDYSMLRDHRASKGF